MDHTYADTNQVAERYALGELSSRDSQDFEVHFFECQECAAAVESVHQFIDCTRIVLSESATEKQRSVSDSHPRRSWPESLWRLWREPGFAMPALAATFFAAVAAYQGFVLLPRLRAGAQALDSYQLAGASRGAAETISVAHGAQFFSLAADLPVEAQASTYVCVLSQGGKQVFRVKVPAPLAGKAVMLLVPAGYVKPGPSQLTIMPEQTGSSPVFTDSFILQIQ